MKNLITSLLRSVVELLRASRLKRNCQSRAQLARSLSKGKGAVVNPSHDRKGVGMAVNMQEQILRGVYPERSRRQNDTDVSFWDGKHPETARALSPEQFRRMLEETLAADPNLARRLLKPLVGTSF